MQREPQDDPEFFAAFIEASLKASWDAALSEKNEAKLLTQSNGFRYLFKKPFNTDSMEQHKNKLLTWIIALQNDEPAIFNEALYYNLSNKTLAVARLRHYVEQKNMLMQKQNGQCEQEPRSWLPWFCSIL
jgi:hypothetical protein